MSTSIDLGPSQYDNNILDPTWYTSPDNYRAAFQHLREAAPIHRVHDASFGKDYWLLTRHEHVRDVLLADTQFSSRLGSRVPRSAQRATTEEKYRLHQLVQLSHIDDPLHSVFRRPMNKHFSAPAVARMGRDLDDFVDDLLGHIAPRGSVDLVEDIAAELPVRVVLRLLGVPEEDWPYLRHTAWQFLAAADPRFTIDNDVVATANLGRERLIEYCTQLALDRRKSPRDDFATLVAEVEIDGDKLSTHEMATWFASLVSAGLTNTRNAIGVGAWLFLQNPDQRQLLLNNPKLIKPAVEEVLRWNAPSRNRLRVVNDDVEFHGQLLRAGDWVVGSISSANWDERAFPNPESFDITREYNPHLSLGAGIHLCLGRALVRLEMAALFPKLLRTLPDMRTVEANPSWIPDASSSGFTTMPIEFTPTHYQP